MTATIGITLGDPAGIGPEIALAAAIQLTEKENRDVKLVFIGAEKSLDLAAKTLKLDKGWKAAVPKVDFVAVGDGKEEFTVGQWSAITGRVAAQTLEEAVKLATSGKIDAIATAPVSKEAVNASGIPFTGHTEMLAKLTGTAGTVMMLAHGKLRVSHISTHIPLSKAASYVTPERVRRVVTLTRDAIRKTGIENPKIAIAGFNPHAGEGGLIGSEDGDVLVPTVAALRADGFNVEGPIPGDTVFVKAAAGLYDAVIAMYHDQGHIPIKLLGFSVNDKNEWANLSGVNVTLGLPIIRTSVDHGTAFDIAGKGTASSQSMVEAIEFAQMMLKTK
jgi:4-phospho-D-threonate 3-dehydrogenase / 4-phospho-D-erythronate 3-dehydrogenase